MTNRLSRLVLAAACAGALLSTPVVSAPPAHAACNAGQNPDPYTGICWSNSSNTLGISGTGGACFPGRVGLCLAALQNSSIPGAALRPMPAAGPAPRSYWP